MRILFLAAKLHTVEPFGPPKKGDNLPVREPILE